MAEIRFPLALPSAATATASATALRDHLDDYLLPRLANPGAPLLIVVGGSTGAGKSTLVNSLVQAPVSAAGVLRPTTRTPVLVCHPADAAWFRGQHLYTSLSGADPGLRLIVAPALPPGLAFLDAPDVDSVEAANRELAHRLFGAADLWLFATTPNRYADAVPWQLLHAARARAAVVALILARVPDAVNAELVRVVSELLTRQGLSQLPVFVIPETRVDRQGLLPAHAIARLRDWFEALAADRPARDSVAQCTLDGALAALPAQLTALATALDEQVAVAERLAEQVGLAYGLARGTVERGLHTGALEAAGADPDQARHRRSAAETALADLVLSAVADAAEQTDSAWRATGAGRALLGAGDLGPSADLPRQVQRVAREQPPDGVLPRIEQLLDAEAARWLDRLAPVASCAGSAKRLRELAGEVERRRVAAAVPPVPAAESTSRPVPARPGPEPTVPSTPHRAAAPPTPAPTAPPTREPAVVPAASAPAAPPGPAPAVRADPVVPDSVLPGPGTDPAAPAVRTPTVVPGEAA